MTANDFVFWLKGYLDASGDSLKASDVEILKKKLGEVQSVGFNPNPWPLTSDKIILTNPTCTEVKPPTKFWDKD